MKAPINEHKIVVFSGAGISAESGLQTFRDAGGLWNEHKVEDVATLRGWQKDPQLVLDFYNSRKKEALNAQPNAAHRAIAELEKNYQVVVITQNVDDLHERAGSTRVIHLHGQLNKACGSFDKNQSHDVTHRDINIGDLCDQGSQLRPHIVWFGERAENIGIARQHLKDAAKVLVVGTSLAVYPAAGILKKARGRAEKLLVTLDVEKVPYGFKWLKNKAAEAVPHIVSRWMNEYEN